MKVTKLEQPKKQHTFPCVLENVASSDAGWEGLIVFFYKTSSHQVIGVVITEGNSTWYPGYYASCWSVDTNPDHWIPVNIQITQEE